MSEPDRDRGAVAPDGRPEDVQPGWRRAFPIDVPREHFLTRRDFTKFLGLTSLAFVVGQFWIVLQSWLRRRQGSPAPKEIARLDQVPIGGALAFTYPEEHDTCVLVRPDERTLLAYNRKCTHLSCAVAPDVDQGCLNCPCHHGVFDLTSGRPIAGPPRRPLPRILLKVEGDAIFATGVELRTV